MAYKREPHYFEKDTFALLNYNRLIREAREWNNSGQYWLGKEAERRAKCLIENNQVDYKRQVHSEELFMKTKKLF